MVSIGMLRKKTKHSMLAKACALVANMEGATFFFFTPDKIDFEHKTIDGQVFEAGDWIEKEMPFPDIVYNDAPSSHEDLYNKLEKEVLFTTHQQGCKLTVYNKIKQDNFLKKYVIPTQKFKSLKQMHQLLDEYTKIVIKPAEGRLGKDITYIEKNQKYRVNNGKADKEFTQRELEEFIENNLDDYYIIQPFLESKTREGQPYDVRAHVQKNGQGEWVLTKLYARIGARDTFVSNVAAGGSIGKIESFLEQEFGPSRSKELQKTLKGFSLDFANRFQNLYKASFDELGIDLAIDKDENIHVFEVNRQPGVRGFFELDVALNVIPYAKYLVENHYPTIREIPTNNRKGLNIFFGGDTFLGKAGKSLLKEKGYDYPFENLKDVLAETDVRTVNLEAPIQPETKAVKANKEFNYRIPKKGVRTLGEEGFSVFYMANNHTTDYGHEGLLETIDYLSERDNAPLGAGNNEMRARSGAGIIKGHEKIGLLNYMSYRKSYDEHFRHFAYHETSGVAVLEEPKVHQDIASLRRKGFQTIVVSVHWGRNYEPVTTKQKREANMLIEAGADIIVGHGSHDYQPMEVRNGVPIFYSIGNFVFTTHGRGNFKYGFPITLSFEQNHLVKVEIWPIYTNNKVVQFQPVHLKGGEAKEALKELFSASTLSGREYEIKEDRGVIYL